MQKNAKCASVQSGFTLIEAVISLAILGLTIAVMVEATSRCLAVIRISRNYHAARTVLEQGELEHPLAESNSVPDNIVMPVDYGNGFTYSRDLEQSADEEDLYVVRSRVTWAEKGRHSFEEVVSYCYCPEEK
ncbi:MAG: type II secretion system protein [Lentisphaerae bacterium]|nr:type II secretion system protein [Lentisphaerota bacterium]